MGKQLTAEQYEKKLAATNTIISFMQELLPRYKADTIRSLWTAMSSMIDMYGLVFIADCIRQSKAEAELALFRYGKKGALL